MKGQIHLIDVEDHLYSFNWLVMRCSAVIEKGILVWSVNNDFTKRQTLAEDEEGFNGLLKCPDCWQNPPILAADKRQYTYALIEGKERKPVFDEHGREMVEAA